VLGISKPKIGIQKRKKNILTKYYVVENDQAKVILAQSCTSNKEMELNQISPRLLKTMQLY